MSSGRYIEGNCKLCGSYTKSIEYEHKGLCLACVHKLDYWTKEDLIKELSKVKKENQKLRWKEK